MTVQRLAFLGLLGLAAAPFVAAPANACTPAPDNPNGCDGINGGRPLVRVVEIDPSIIRPLPIGPTCLSCPPYASEILRSPIDPPAQSLQLQQMQLEQLQLRR